MLPSSSPPVSPTKRLNSQNLAFMCSVLGIRKKREKEQDAAIFINYLLGLCEQSDIILPSPDRLDISVFSLLC